MAKRWGCIALASFACLFYRWHPEMFQQSIALIHHGDAAVLADFLQGFGLWGIIVTIALFVVMTFTIVFPFILLSAATGIVYGIFWGIVISWLGEVIGAIIMFIFIRYCLSGFVEKWLKKRNYSRQIAGCGGGNAFKALLIARLLPPAPSGIITAVSAVSRISWRDFLLATVIGKLPPVIFKVMVGHDIAFAGQNRFRLIAVSVFVVVMYSALWFYRQSRQKAAAR
jgi:uncharacterized membrane protein YdjX (TVP38/TMEM64 family)